MQLFRHYTSDVCEKLPHKRAAGDYYDVMPWLKSGMHVSYGFTQKTAHPVSNNRLPQRFAGDEAIAVMIETVVRHAQRHPSVVVRPSFAAQTFEVVTGPEAKALLHSRRNAGLACVPVGLFDMDTRHGKFMTATQTTRLQNTATVLGLHTLAETMHASTTADFWLVSTLC